MRKPKNRADNSTGGILRSVFYVALATFALVMLFVGTSDIQCNSDINMRLPVYPESDLLNVDDSGFFRLRGMGLMYAEYTTPDTPETVREWYRDYLNDLRNELRAQGEYGSPSNGLARTSYSVQANPTGNGTRITLQSECGYGLSYGA